jgi:hypothetical protein
VRIDAERNKSAPLGSAGQSLAEGATSRGKWSLRIVVAIGTLAIRRPRRGIETAATALSSTQGTAHRLIGEYYHSDKGGRTPRLGSFRPWSLRAPRSLIIEGKSSGGD